MTEKKSNSKLSSTDNPKNPIDEENYTNALIKKFEQAMEARQKNDLDSCCELLLHIIKNEPRLPEPHLELANIYLLIEKLEDARVHIEEAITYLENGGQWTDMDLNLILSLAYSTKSEVYHALADRDEIVLSVNEVEFVRLITISKNAKKKANELNPNQQLENYAGGNLMFQIEEDEEEVSEDSSSFE